MDDASALLNKKTAQVESERALAAARAEDCLREHEALLARISELDIVLKHLRQWASDCGVEVREDRAPAWTAARKPPPIRTMVRTYLRSVRQFTGRALVGAVQAQAPSALMRSVRAELSHCTRRGEAKRIGQDQYTSLIAPDGESAHPTREERDEPGVGFGRVGA